MRWKEATIAIWTKDIWTNLATRFPTILLQTILEKLLERQRPPRWWWVSTIALPIALLLGLSACSLPQVSAEDRLFLDLSLEFLGEYRLPKQEFQGGPVGGLSAITYDRQQDRVYALSDDRSEFAPARFYTLKLDLKPTETGITLGKVDIEQVTTLTNKAGQPYARGTIDTEGIALSPSRSLFISSEGVAHDGIPPFVNEFDLQTGAWRRSLPLPDRYLPKSKQEPGQSVSGQDAQAPSNQAQTEPAQGIQDNLGFESLTINPGGYGNTGLEPFRLFTAPESALQQDRPSDPTQAANARVLHYLLEDDRALLISEHLYPIDPAPEVLDPKLKDLSQKLPGSLTQVLETKLPAARNGLSELLAIDQGGHFLSLERSFSSLGFGSKLFQLSMGGATDTSTIPSLQGTQSRLEPIRKKLLLDLAQLSIPLDNLEGITLGPRLPDGTASLLMVSDDNFRSEQVTQFLLFRLRGLS